MKGRKRKRSGKAQQVFNSNAGYPGRTAEARDSAGGAKSGAQPRSDFSDQEPGPESAEMEVIHAWGRSDLSEQEALDLAYHELHEARRSRTHRPA